jgi:penicillin-binding protein 1A
VKRFFGRLGSRWAGFNKKQKAARAALTLVAAGVVLGVGFTGYVYAMWRSAPELSELSELDNGENSTLYAEGGERLGVVQSETLRTALEAEEIPRLVEQATVAIEDRRFYEHEGVDFEAVLRAAIKNFRSGEVVEGGSTITQQVVKNLYISDDRTFARKVREAKLASAMDERRTKEEILALYLNNVPYGTINGQSAIGIEAAARTFFAKPADELRLHEAALLAGLPRAPDTYNPFENEDAALERRNEVLRALVATGKVSPERARAATEKPLGVERGSFYTRQEERYFFEFVKQQLIDRYGEKRVERGGLKVYTTVDVDLQEDARESIRSALDRGDDPSAAAVSIDPETGGIKAMVTSEKFSRTKFNYAAQSKRQPGSAFKPIVLMTALSRGVDPNKTTYRSKPLDFETERYGEIDVETYDERYYGNIDLERATLKSDNTVFQQLALDLGLADVTANARRLGIEAELESRPAEALGGLKRGVSPLEMARTYATLASGGVRTEARAIKRIVFPDRERDALADPQGQRAYSEAVSAEVTDILEQNIQRGTGREAGIGCPAAGKTGTTDDFKDAWFVGYTPRLSTAVWVGYADPKPMREVHGVSVSGSNFPAQIWGDYMSSAVSQGCGEFPDPSQRADLDPYCAKYTTTRKCDDKDKERESEGERERAREQERAGARERQGDRGSAGEDEGSSEDGGGSSEPNGGGGNGDGGGSQPSRAPNTRIDDAPPKTTSDRSARFSFSATGGGARGFECQLDGGGYRSCDSPKRYSGLERGRHTFRVRAIGSGGRRDSSPASYSWRIRRAQSNEG